MDLRPPWHDYGQLDGSRGFRGVSPQARRAWSVEGNQGFVGILGGNTPPTDPASYEGTYDAETAKLVLDEMAADAGVRIYYFAQVVHAFKSEDGRRVTAVAIQSKEGRHVIEGKVFIDSSGDGDLAALAGAAFEIGRPADAALQPMTMIFKMDNVDTERALAYMHGEGGWGFQRDWKAAKARGEVTIHRDSVITNPSPKPGQWSFNCTRLQGYDGTRLKDVSAAMIEGRGQVAEVTAFMRKYIPGFENAILAETASHIGVRETRRVKCAYTITGETSPTERSTRTRLPAATGLSMFTAPLGPPTLPESCQSGMASSMISLTAARLWMDSTTCSLHRAALMRHTRDMPLSARVPRFAPSAKVWARQPPR